ncbi:arginine--tRNA ligase [Patescibacteria group bacterium]|nr:arginine--tRNA ligase [Patescibacteria group bacterium]
MKPVIRKIILQALDNLGFDKIQVQTGAWVVERPGNLSHGDWTSNVAMKLFGQLLVEQKKQMGDNLNSPRALAEAITTQIKKLKKSLTEASIVQVAVAGPGFINFSLADEFYTAKMTNILRQGAPMIAQTQKGQKVVVEFTDPNPFKEFHIGHLYNNSVGEAISRLYELAGAQVQRACYQGDVGMHVAKSIWGMIHKLHADSPKASNWRSAFEKLSQLSLSKRIHFLGQAYALGATAYKDDQVAQKDMQTINYATYLAGQEDLVEKETWQPQVDYSQFLKDSKLDYEQIKTLYQQGRAWSLEYFEVMYRRLGTKFDQYYFESLVGEFGLKLVKAYLKKGVFEKSQGAVIFPGEKYGLHNRVFINSVGLPTYEAKELGLAPEKYRRFAYDRSIVITGNEIDEYFQVLLKALSLIEPELAVKTTHLSHAMVRLPEGKMSSRTGQILTGEWLLDEAKKRSLEKIKQVKVGQKEDGQEKTASALSEEKIAEIVGLAAVKYSLLKSSIGQDIAFSFKDSLSFQGNSGPYLLYTYVRTQSIWSKLCHQPDINPYIAKSIDTLLDNKSYLKYQPNIDEKLTLRYIALYIDALTIAVEQNAPHIVAGAIFDLASAFNTFYAHHQVTPTSSTSDVGSLEPDTAWRLLLTTVVGQVMKQGLHVLGIPVVNKM